MDPEPTSARWNGTVTECALYLGIDGGGSRCRAIAAWSAAAAHACRIDRHAWSMPNRVVAGPELPSRRAAPYSSSMRAREDFALMHARIGLAGLGRRGAQTALKEIAHPFASVRFTNDELTACLGAHGGADGAIVVAGTSSIGVGLIGGRELRFGGYCAARARRETSPLLEELLGAFDHDPLQAVAWSEQAIATDYAAFAPMVLRHAWRVGALLWESAERERIAKVPNQ